MPNGSDGPARPELADLAHELQHQLAPIHEMFGNILTRERAVEAGLAKLSEQVDSLNVEVVAVKHRLDGVERRLDALETRVTRIESAVQELKTHQQLSDAASQDFIKSAARKEDVEHAMLVMTWRLMSLVTALAAGAFFVGRAAA